MKRSEMIEHLEVLIDRIYDLRVPEGAKTCAAITLLNQLEKLGMLPPPYTYIPGNPDKPSFIGSGIKCEWEPEDE